MPHHTGVKMSGIPHPEGLRHSHVDHNPHEDVPGSDRFSEGKVRKMAEGRS